MKRMRVEVCLANFLRRARGASLILRTASILGLLGLAPRPDEKVILFPSFGVFNAAENLWELEFHGWVFQPEEGSLKRRLLLSMLSKSLKLDPADEANAFFQERARQFLVDNKRGRVITIEIAGRPYSLGPSEENGHFTQTLKLPVQEVQAALGENLKGGMKRLPFQMKLPSLSEEEARQEIVLLDAEGHSLISDLDDTVKVTNVSNRKALLQNTFLKEFAAVPGISEYYREYSTNGVPIHFVTAAPWQLYPTLNSFFVKEKIPLQSISMKNFRWKDSSFFELFAQSDVVKRPFIEAILQKFPKRRFTLVGDSGEGDAELYASLAAKYPEQIEKILIRSTIPGSPPPQALLKLPVGQWQFFSDVKELLNK